MASKNEKCRVKSDEVRKAPKGKADGFQPGLLTSAAFDQARYGRRWLVRSILLPEQVAVIGGPKKCLKTSLVTDLAISLGSETPFLGRFKVPKAVRAAVFSGESGGAVLQETARRIAKVRGIALGEADVLWSFDLPRLARKQDLGRLHAILKDQGVAVLFLDPLYLCLLDGATNASASNLFDVGPLLRRAADACRTAGTTLVLVHHTVKSLSKSAQAGPVGLDHLAFAGIGEFARQWLLVNRLEPYRPGSGRHRLLLVAEGSAGHSGAWELDVREGTLGEDFGAREWTVTVRNAGAPGIGEW
jgi:replicative DNA helicase